MIIVEPASSQGAPAAYWLLGLQPHHQYAEPHHQAFSPTSIVSPITITLIEIIYTVLHCNFLATGLEICMLLYCCTVCTAVD